MADWTLTFQVDPASSLPLFVQIARAISEDVRRGRLLPGTRLPGTRRLAGALDVNRNTIAAAYSELEAEGWVTASTGSGTFVSDSLHDLTPGRVDEPRKKAKSRRAMGFDLTISPPGEPDDVAFPGALKWDFGIPDVRLAPTRELARAYRRALRSHGNELLQYERYRVARHARLQVALATMLRGARGLDLSHDQLVVTQGSQMAIYLVARCLIRPGDVVALENPGVYRLRDLFRELGATVAPIEVDQDGIVVDRIAEQRGPLRAVLLTPHHQFPTTVTLSVARRMQLLELARRRRFVIIEDDYDHEFHYDGRPVLPLASTDDWGSVVYIGSLSKLFGPGLRLGYLVAPEPLARAARDYRHLIDIQGDGVVEAALAELFEEGEMLRHLNRARRVYAARRDFLVELLRKRLGSSLEIQVPSGGMALWARVDPSIDIEVWRERARGHGLLFRSGSIFSLRNEPLPFVRLGFARLTEAELLEATALLAKALPRPRRR